MMKIFRTLFVAAALVSTHWMGMTMARTFDPADAQTAQRHTVESVEEPAAEEKVAPVQMVVTG